MRRWVRRPAVAGAVAVMLAAALPAGALPPPPARLGRLHETVIRRVEGLSPTSVGRREASGAGVALRLQARGLTPGVRVQIGPHLLPDSNVAIDSSGASLSFKDELPAGLYLVRVRWPDGKTLCSPWPLAVQESTCRLQDVPFQKNETAIEGEKADPAAQALVADNVACLARTSSEQPVLALGFASADGLEDSNTELAKRRAEVVASRVAGQLPLASVQAVGLGHALPVQLGDDEPDLAKNRRVTLVSGRGLPCQPVRLTLGADGAPTQESRNLLGAAAQCFADRNVTSVLVVLSDGEGKEAAQDAGKLADVMKEVMAPAASRSPHVQIAHASAKDRELLSKAFGAAMPASQGRVADVLPIGWFAGNAPLQATERPDPTCTSEEIVTPPEPPAPVVAPAVVQPDVTPWRAPKSDSREAFAQLRFTGLRALDQTHVGGTVRAGRSLFGSSQATAMLLGMRLGMFAGEEPYRIAEDLTSTFLLQAHGVIGVSRQMGPLRLEAALLPGVMLPAASAFVGDADGTVAWRISEGAELLGTFGGGISVWQDGGTDPHWFGETGIGWWF